MLIEVKSEMGTIFLKIKKSGVFTLLLISACSHDIQTTSDKGTVIKSHEVQLESDDWVGKWLGVEGLYLNISKKEGTEGAGKYILDMKYGLDEGDSGHFQGYAVAEGIAFTRMNENYVLRRGSGEETGLKWLARKKHCFIVQFGEAYCRD